jgi:HEAT repeat protein
MADRPQQDAINDAIAAPDGGEERWERVTGLQRAGDEDTFQAIAALLDSDDARERALAADVLAQFGADLPAEARPYRKAVADLLLTRLAMERDPRPLAALATAFGHLDDVRALPALLELARHEDEGVRFGAAFALEGSESPEAIEALIGLSRDADDEVRDRATFGLGSVLEVDNEQIRQALRDRIKDEDADVRSEAILGLARRGDDSVIADLVADLEAQLDASTIAPDHLHDALLILATRTADPALCRYVESAAHAWRASSSAEEDLPSALRQACLRCDISL